MADNYLEKRMDDYRHGKLSGSRAAVVSTLRKRQGLTLDLSGSRVFAAVGDDRLLDAITSTLSEGGCRVAFCMSDVKSGRAKSQREGSLFYPLAEMDICAVVRGIETVAARWGGIDILVTDLDLGDIQPMIKTPCRVVRIDSTGNGTEVSCDAVAASVALLVTSAGASIKSIEI